MCKESLEIGKRLIIVFVNLWSYWNNKTCNNRTASYTIWLTPCHKSALNDNTVMPKHRTHYDKSPFVIMVYKFGTQYCYIRSTNFLTYKTCYHLAWYLFIIKYPVKSLVINTCMKRMIMEQQTLPTKELSIFQQFLINRSETKHDIVFKV
jgi:hypothetical protein